MEPELLCKIDTSPVRFRTGALVSFARLNYLGSNNGPDHTDQMYLYLKHVKYQEASLFGPKRQEGEFIPQHAVPE